MPQQIAAPGTSTKIAPSTASTETVTTALQNFQGSLSATQKQDLLKSQSSTLPDGNSVLSFRAEIDASAQRRASRCVASRLQGVLDSVQQYTSVVGTFVSSNPAVAALVWGSLRFTILAASNFSSFFEKLTTWFMTMQKCCPRFKEYQLMFPHSKRLQEALCEFYASLIDFCTQAVIAINRSGWFNVAKSFWVPFEKEFKQYTTTLQLRSKDVDEEIRLAFYRAAHYEQKMQIADRKQAIIARASSRLMKSKVDQLTQEEQAWRKQLQEREDQARKRQLLDGLSNYDYISPFKRVRKKRFGSIGCWLISTTEYQKWLRERGSSVFWLSGIMGSGKTILTASVIDDLLKRRATNLIKIVFFHILHNNADSLRARTVLQSMLRQCLTIEDIHRLEPAIERLSSCDCGEDEFEESLLVVFSRIPANLYIVLDGLDEMLHLECKIVLSALSKLFMSSEIAMKLFISSRDDIGVDLRTTFPSLHHRTTLCQECADDIVQYVTLGINEKIRDGELTVGNRNLIPTIKQKLVEGAQGMFLWVFFQIEELCAQTNDKEILYVLETLPKDLPSTYQRSLSKILRDGKREVVKKMLLFAATVKRPLSRMELRDAIAVQPDQEFFEPSQLVNDVQRMVSWSHNLLLLDEEDDLVMYAHYTIKDFLWMQLQCTNENLSEFNIDRKSADILVGHICCTYIQFRNFENQVVPVADSKPHRIVPRGIASMAISQTNNSILAKPWLTLEKFKYSQASPKSTDAWLCLQRHSERDPSAPSKQETHHFMFLDYASLHWLDHTADTTPDEKDAWNAFNRTFLAINRNTIDMQPFSIHEWEEPAPPVSRYISLHNHLGLIFKLIATDMIGIGTNRTTTWLKNYLSLIPPIITSGSWTAFYILMKGCATNSVCPNDLNDWYFSYYRRALEADKALTAIWLLRFSLKILDYTVIPFKEGLIYGQQSHRNDASENIRSQFEEAGKSAVYMSTRYAIPVRQVEPLLEIDRRDAPHYKAMRLAISEGPIRVLRLLVLYERRVFNSYVHSLDGLLSAVENRDVHGCRRLIEAGVDPHYSFIGQPSSILFHTAIKKGHFEILHSLLASGSPPDIPSSTQWSPLCTAVAKGDPEMVSMLLQAGADPNKIVTRADEAPGRPGHRARPSGELTTPLLEAVIRDTSSGLDQIITLLLEGGAHISVTDLPRIPKIASLAYQYQEYSKYISLERQYGVFGKCAVEEVSHTAKDADMMATLERQYDEHGKCSLD